MPVSRKCGLCNTDAKYKCPICRFPFCSVTCGNEHKSSGNCDVQEETVNVDSAVDRPMESSEKEKLLAKQLRGSAKVMEVIKNRKLREMMVSIDSAADPAVLLDAAMHDPDFQVFLQAALEATSTEST